jgi:hypothetical protein
MKVKITRDFRGALFGCDSPFGETVYSFSAGSEVELSEVEARQAKARGICECEIAENVPQEKTAEEKMKEKYTVVELRKMYEEKTGKKPGRMNEAALVAALLE